MFRFPCAPLTLSIYTPAIDKRWIVTNMYFSPPPHYIDNSTQYRICKQVLGVYNAGGAEHRVNRLGGTPEPPTATPSVRNYEPYSVGSLVCTVHGATCGTVNIKIQKYNMHVTVRWGGLASHNEIQYIYSIIWYDNYITIGSGRSKKYKIYKNNLGRYLFRGRVKKNYFYNILL